MKMIALALGAVIAVGVMLAPLSEAQTPTRSEVWNTGKTYHCPGTRWFKTTKTGNLMSEQAAKAAGASPARGKTCAEVSAAAKAKASGAATKAPAKGGGATKS